MLTTVPGEYVPLPVPFTTFNVYPANGIVNGALKTLPGLRTMNVVVVAFPPFHVWAVNWPPL